jgi:hypothetical protein
MSFAVKIVDQTPGVHPTISRNLRLASERTTLREVLAKRIAEDVSAFNAGSDAIRLLVAPTEPERSLNDRATKPRTVDAGRQLAAAVQAFERTRILVVVDEQQVLDLDQPLIVTPDTVVRFVKLVPLVGG